MGVNSEMMLSLILFVTIATLSPGGATALATASGAQFGFRRSVPLISGIAIGLASLAAVAAAGLAGLFLAVPSLQLTMRLVGSAFLLWLAWRIIRSGRPKLDPNKAQTPINFITGALLLWLNPKGWAVTLAAAASYSALTASPAALAAVLGVAFGVSAVVSLSIWCMAGLVLARMLRTDLHWHLANAVLGLLLAVSIVPIWRD